MSISTAQYIDLLFKKLQGVAKTATAAQKSASNESIASPALLRGDIVWTQADQIPGSAQAVSGIAQAYLTTGRIECTADNTVPTIGGIYPTWLTNLQYWIPQEFGSTWPVKVYVDTAGAANPTVTGSQIFAPGIGGVGEFFFDTQAGVLNFIGETIPASLTAGKSIFITGYRYVGLLGVTNLASANIGNIQITGNTIVTLNTNGDLVFDPNGSGNVRIVANTAVTGNLTLSGFVSAVGNVSGNYFIGNGSQLTGVSASSVNANALIGNTLSSNVLYSSLTQVGTLSNVSVSGNVVGGNVLTGGIVSATGSITSKANIDGGNLTTAGQVTATGNVTGSNILTSGVVSATANITGGNILFGTGVVSGTGNIQGGNLLTAGVVSATSTITGGNVLTGGLISATGNITSAANITGGNVLTGGAVSATGNVTSGGVVTTGPSGNISGANVVSATTFTATGNITGGNILSNNYYYANGTPVPPGIVYTANTAPPVSPAPKVTDQWYDISSDILYEFLNDGTSTYWVDTTSPAFAGGVVANVAISGNMLPVANISYDVGSSGSYFNQGFFGTVTVGGNVIAGNVVSNTVTASVLANATAIALQTNGSNALTIDSSQNITTARRLPAASMPAGAVVQTVMSSVVGGSITNSTSYVDITSATVVITPSRANSKVLVLATGTSSFSALVGYGVTADTQLVRSPSSSLQVQNIAASGSGGVGLSGAVAYSYTDSPGTTSPVTYKLQQRVSNAASTLTSTNIWLIALEITA